jgi:hypothetical protein
LGAIQLKLRYVAWIMPSSMGMTINPKLLIRASASYYNSPLKFGSTCIAGVELGCPTKFS